MPLYHFSENPNIERFVPRAPKNHPDAQPMVWAIDDWHAPLYYFPADCPRACFWPLPSTTREDRARYWHDEGLRMIIYTEAKRFTELGETKLYRYTLDDAGFIDCEDHGVWVSPNTVVPLSIEALGPLVAEFGEAKVELRLCPSLVPIGQLLQTTSLHWSLIRMRFAEGWQAQGGTPMMPKGQ